MTTFTVPTVRYDNYQSTDPTVTPGTLQFVVRDSTNAFSYTVTNTAPDDVYPADISLVDQAYAIRLNGADYLDVIGPETYMYIFHTTWAGGGKSAYVLAIQDRTHGQVWLVCLQGDAIPVAPPSEVSDFHNNSTILPPVTGSGFGPGATISFSEFPGILESQADTVTGTESADFYAGGMGLDHLQGAGGNDTLNGGVGQDTLVGGSGNDVLVGGSGHDLLDGDAGGDRAIFNGTAATTVDLQLIGPQDTGHGFDTLLNIEHLISGRSNDRLTGNSAANSLTSGAGSDTLYGLGGNDILAGGIGADRLDGGAGTDTMSGGAGNDLYIVNLYYLNSGLDIDVVIEAADQGQDTVESSVSYALADNVETLVLTGTKSIGGLGNLLDNTITGNRASNILEGGGNGDLEQAANGSDTIYGMAGHDTIYAGGGADLLIGGIGNDWIYGDEGDDVIEGGDGNDEIWTGGYASSAYSEDFASETADGRAGNDLIWGGTGDTLDGGAGNDTIIGHGLDQVLIGGSGDDVLSAGDLWAEASGAIDGGAGEDTLGAERSILGLSLTRVETLNASSYTVSGTAEQFGLFSHVVRDGDPSWKVSLDVVGTGTADLSLSLGTRGAEIFTSLDGNNLTTGAGSDVFYIGSSTDTLNGGAGDDMFAFRGQITTGTLVGGNGTDVLWADYAGVDHQSISGLSLSGIEILDVSTTVYATTAQFDSFDTIRNHYGLFKIYLQLVGAGSADLSDELGTTAVQITNSADGNGIITGSAADMLSGAAGNDALDGGAGNDSLSGASGSDTLYGGAGDDVLAGARGNDVMTGGSGLDLFVLDLNFPGVDQIVDFNPSTDTIQLEHSELAAGQLSFAAFRASATGLAESAADGVIYNTATGQLYFDADGNGANAAVLLATLPTGLSATYLDFWIA